MKKIIIRIISIILVSVLAIFALTNLRYCLSQKQRIETLNLDSEEFAGELIIGVRYKNSPKATLVSLESSSEIADGNPGFGYQSSNLAIYAKTRIFEVDEVTLTIFYGLGPRGNINGEHVEFSLQIEFTPCDYGFPNKRWDSEEISLSNDYLEHPDDYFYDTRGYDGMRYLVESFERFNQSVTITLPSHFFLERVGEIKFTFMYDLFSIRENIYTKTKSLTGDTKKLAYIHQGNKVVLFDGYYDSPLGRYE